MNDVIDIYDAIVVNYQIEFYAVSDSRYENSQVLFSCIEALKEYFEDIAYIGEPLYITRLYETINRVDPSKD